MSNLGAESSDAACLDRDIKVYFAALDIAVTLVCQNPCRWRDPWPRGPKNFTGTKASLSG